MGRLGISGLGRPGVVEGGEDPILQDRAEVRLHFNKQDAHAVRFDIQDMSGGFKKLLVVENLYAQTLLRLERSGEFQETTPETELSKTGSAARGNLRVHEVAVSS